MTSANMDGTPFEESIWVDSRNTHMLLEDFENNVVPYRRHGEPYVLTVNGLSADAVSNALELSRRGDGAESFVNGVASTLLMDHEAWLEIFFNDPSPSGLPFRVFPVTGVRQTRAGSWTRNLGMPDGEAFWAFNSGERSNSPVAVDIEKLIHVQLPVRYSGDIITEVIKGLVETDSISNSISQREIDSLLRPTSTSTPMDPTESYRTERLRVAQAGLPIGWTAREILSRDSMFTEYFYHWRELWFLHFRASMRERAEAALCQVLAMAGKHCGFKASVTSTRLYAPTEVELLIKKFEEGEISFTETLNIMREMSETFPAQAREICKC